MKSPGFSYVATTVVSLKNPRVESQCSHSILHYINARFALYTRLTSSSAEPVKLLSSLQEEGLTLDVPYFLVELEKRVGKVGKWRRV